jgi:UDPglucose--hexose-1-phosphate uridylyltransferase
MICTNNIDDTIYSVIECLLDYAKEHSLIAEEDVIFSRNSIFELLGISEAKPAEMPESRPALPEILDAVTAYAIKHNIIEDLGITGSDLFDTKVMGLLTPRPSEVCRRFGEEYKKSPEAATDWYYDFSQATNYIRADRIKRDLRWKYNGKYGELDITVNLSKPEKDPKAIAAALSAKKSNYPQCLLCRENVGYAGNMNSPARQNHRTLPLSLDGEDWYLQYSPYVYYNEHCICFNSSHTPMHIDREAFNKLCDFVTQFPHYFIGSNADLPIVGGSILTHDHYQGGHYTFAMEKAPIESELTFKGYEDIKAGIVKWPLSVIRLNCSDRERICELADKILLAWRTYTDEDAFVFANTDNTPHSTVTPIARRKGENYELDLVLRNNITTDEHPLGVYHPHEKLHHIKKENIGLIEVMGLAVLPARLKAELAELKNAMLKGEDLTKNEATAKHADWANDIIARRPSEITPEKLDTVLNEEVGYVFEQVLEDAGVYKCTDEGRTAFARFIDYVNNN